MSTRIEITSASRGLVWVFAVDIEEADITRFTARNGDWPLARALGVEALDAEHVEVFPVKDLEGVGLAGYLEQGLGVVEDQLDGLRGRLDGVTGVVMVLTTRAFGDDSVVLTPKAPLRLIASFSEDRSPVQFEPLPDDGAKGEVTPKARPQPSDAAMSGRLAMAALAVLGIMVAIMVWVA